TVTLVARLFAGLLCMAVGGSVLVTKPALRLPPVRPMVVSSMVLVILFCMIEAGSRIWLSRFASPVAFARYAAYAEVHPRKRKLSPHHYLNYYTTPMYRHGPTRHNSLGFRGPEIAVPKPAGVYRIVVLGGSTVYTAFVADDARTFPAQLQEQLRGKHGFHAVEVINAGVPGYNSWESLINLVFRVLDLDPDLLLVYHGTNEVHARLVRPDAYRGDNSGRRRQWQEPRIAFLERSVFLRILRRRWGLSFQAGVETVVNAPTFVGAGSAYPGRVSLEQYNATLDANPPRYARRNLVSMIALAEAHGIDIVLASWASSQHFGDYAAWSFYRRGFEEQNRVTREVAVEKGVPFFDFASVMSDDRAYWHDGRHVNVKGARKKAELFADFLAGSGLLPSGGHSSERPTSNIQRPTSK
ncbi:MAG: hypothetical protein HQ559_17070, partial [Lentisphaerae bacterium]|nr:hypothetical protein [Lentisphaerota bacterium]